MADAGSATFRAIADFSRLRKESRAAARELRGVKDSARDADRSLAEAQQRSEDAAKALRSSQQQVRRSSEALEAARRREADAAGRVRIAEQQLADVRAKSGGNTARRVAAEERLAKTMRDLDAAQRNTVKRSGELDAAQERLVVSTREVEQAQARLRGSTERSTSVWGRLRQAVRGASDDHDRFGNVVSGIGKRLPRVIGLITKLTAVLGAAALASGALHAGAAGVMSLVGAIGALSGAVGVLPAVFAAAGAGIATLKIGLSGFGDVMKAVAEGDAEAFEESLKGLTPAAQGVARALWELRPAFQAIKDTVQERLFSGLADQVRELGRIYLPMLQNVLGDVATSMNRAAREVAGFMRESRAVDATRRIFDRIGDAFDRLVPSARNLVEAFLDIADVGSEFLAPIADGITDATRRFREFIAQARESGQLREWIGTGIDAVKRLGSTVGNVGSIIMGVFRAAESTGRNFLVTLDEGTEKIAAWVNSTKGQTALADFFRAASDAAATLVPILVAVADVVGTQVAPLLARLANQIGPGVESVVRGLGTAFEVASPHLEDFFAAVGDLLDALGGAGPLVGALAGGLADVLTPAVQALTWALEALTGWFNSLPQPMQELVGGLGGVALAAGVAVFALGRIIAIGRSVVATFGAIKAAAAAVGLIKMPDLDVADADRKGAAAGKVARGGFLRALGDGLATAAGAVFSGSFWAKAGALLGRVGPKLLQLGRFLGPWGLAITTAITAAWALWDNWDQVSTFVSDAATAVGDKFAEWGPKIGEALASAGLAVLTWFADLPGKIGEWLAALPQQLWDLFVAALTYAAEGVGYGIGLILAAVVGIPVLISTALWELGQILWQLFTDAWQRAKQATIDAGTAIYDWALGLPGRIRDAVASLGETLSRWASDAWSWADRTARDITNGTVDWLTRLPGRIGDAVSALPGQIDRWARDTWDRASRAFGDGVRALEDWARGLPGRIANAVGNVGQTLYNAGASIIEGFGRGIKNAVQDVYNFVSGIAGRIAALKGPITYDRVLLVEHGRSIIDGLNRGLQSQFPQVEKTLRSMTDAIPDLTMPVRTTGLEALRNAAALSSGIGVNVAPTLTPRLGDPTWTGAGVSVSVTQNIYNPAPETPSESLTRRMRRVSELGLREALDRRAG